MNRGLAAAWSWRFPYYRRVSPGLAGGLLYLLLPLLALLPLEEILFFDMRWQGVATLTWFYAVALALGIAARRGLREDDAIWLFQKGVPLWEAAAEDWILDLGVFVAAALWWATVGTLVVVGSGGSPGPMSPGLIWSALLALAVTTLVLTHGLAVCFSAWGVRRHVDLTVLVLFLSLTFPLLVGGSSPLLESATEWAAPPFRNAWLLARDLPRRDFAGVVGPLFHLLLYTGLLLAAAFWRISRWRPRG